MKLLRSRQEDNSGVKFLKTHNNKVHNKEGLGKNDCGKRNNTCGSPHNGLVFRIWSESKHIAYTFFAFLPPARFYSNALKGIEKLELLNEGVVDKDRKEIKDMKRSSVRRGDKGFRELLKVLKESRVAEGEVDRIVLFQEKAGVMIGSISPEYVRFLAVERQGKQEIIKTDPFEPNKPIRELKNWVEDEFKKQLSYWMIILIAILLGANSYMLYVLNT